jgi:glutathione S-transferase
MLFVARPFHRKILSTRSSFVHNVNIPPLRTSTKLLQNKKSYSNQASMGSNTETPKITLYTAHQCPWAHRSQIALRELGLPFETVIVDLSKPRTPEYLAINPRGLVPALDYNGEILAESGLISQFLVDAHPSHLLKASSEPGGALERFKIGFFVDTYMNKVNSQFWPLLRADEAEKEELATKFTDSIVKEIEPLLKDAAPFYGGSSRLTLAEVCSVLWF